MSLKQSIVVVNEYTIKNSKGGSRGGTPGDYVLRYMARDKAVEDLTPVRYDNENYIMRYMAREEATETCNSVGGLKKDMREIQGNGGVAFGYGDISLSHKKLKAASKDIQNAFDNGKTVMKTVLSFTEDYLRENNIIDPDFEFHNRGDYRGNIDQMRLRMAIMNGLDRMARHYDDLQYVGVIQVDTAHVHCHLAMVDRGVGNLAKDGTQKGKISERCKSEIRRGIDTFLDEKQTIKMLCSNVSYDKRNTLCFIKKYTHEAMKQNGFTQFLVSCLPEDKRKWRAGTNDKTMRKANELTREFVRQVLDEQGSGFTDALADVIRYAYERQRREGLSSAEMRKLINNGQEQIIEDCMNGVYSVIKQIPDSTKSIRTPMLDIMSSDFDVVANEHRDDPTIEFGFKLRSYSSRLDHHKKETHRFRDAAKKYEDAETTEDSKPLYDFFKEEEQYNMMLMSKYQHFLMFLPDDGEYEEDFKELMDYEAQLDNFDKLRHDKSLKRMGSETAEEYGFKVYGVHGGRYATFAPTVLDARYDVMRDEYARKQDDFKLKLADYGLSLNDNNKIIKQSQYAFDDVKALDLHHLGYDWTYDVPISKRNVDAFVNVANTRYAMYNDAKQYLERSNQTDALENLPGKDIELMKEMADQMSVSAVLVTNKPTGGKLRSHNTIRLDVNYDVQFETAVKSTLQQIQF